MRCAHHSLAAAAAAAVALLSAAGARADPAPFDLAGPTIDVQVTRGASTLPIARVPNLAPGDRVWMKAALAAGQSARYLMVAAFLRGSIDPPPAEWFFRCETWSGKCAKEGITVTVPPDARQLLVFLAPETGGDFKTLVNAVRGRPGVFVRTSQDLSQAALEHVRLEAYLAAIRGLGDADPARLKEAAPLLSRSLAIKVDEKCLEKVLEVQASCLMQGRESLIMTDGHSASMAQELTSGPASDLAMQASSAPQLKSGLYGPFVGSLLDIARLLDSFRTAQYQYIPALGAAEGRELRLTLNAAPSFHDPKSVLVVALPAVQAPQPPPLRAVDPKETYCARKDPLILPVEGAPLVFATSYAHGMRLTVATKGGAPLELPAKADPLQGGFAIDTSNLRAATLEDGARASLQGEWGFDKYQGPSFQLTDARDQSWELVTGDEAALIAGREDAIRLRAGSARCVAEVALHDANGKDLKVEWKVAKPDELDLKLSLQEASPGNLTLLIREHGHSESHPLVLRTYAEAAHLESFALHAGDRQGVLRGTRLDEVDKLTLEGVEFAPGTLSSSLGRDELVKLAAPAAPDSGDFRSAEATAAHVALKDGRTVEVKASVEAPRPSAILVGKSAQFAAARDEANIRLSSPDELPQNARLTFSLRAQTPAVFAHDEKIEVATADGAWSTLLDTANGALTLQNARVAVATLDPAKALGAAAFGPLQFRRVANGVAGDWKSLATLVRLPTLTNLRCPAAFGTGCTLSGANLFLLDSVSGDAQFAAPTAVPEGFTGESLGVPQPAGNQLYLKLRDDPSVVSIATVAVQGPSPSGESRGPEHSP